MTRWRTGLVALLLLSACGDDDSSSGIDARAIDGPGSVDGASPDAPAAVDAAPCCVVVSGLEAGTQSFCVSPSIMGRPAAATPTIAFHAASGATRAWIRLHAGLSQTTPQANSLVVEVFDPTGAGDYSTPLIEYYNDAATWFENNGSTGSAHLDQWTDVGTTITGSFQGMVANMGGSGPATLDLSGSLCAVRVADE